MRTIFCLSTFLAGICSSLAARQAVLTQGSDLNGVSSTSNNNVILTSGSSSNRTDTLSLSSIRSTEHFTTLNLPELPYHSVRIKKSTFCDPTVNVYTGYLDVDEGAKHLFFYFFESRRDPDNDDLMMWINGGPGCSSSIGLLMELGPCTIDMSNTSSNRTTWNPYSWNNEANVFFLDQPVGVGFSYADYGESIGTTEDAAKNVHAFITIFLRTFGQFSKRSLHLAGESYAGRYLPLFASEIVDQNQRAALEGGSIINLKSVLIGNGLTDISTLYEGRFEVECGVASLDVPLQYISTCVRMKQALPRCQNMLDNACAKSFDSMNCRAAVVFCEDELSTGFWATGRNVYDMSKSCLGSDLCYFEIGNISSYLNLPSTRSLLGIETPQNFSSCSSKVGRLFDAHDDLSAVHTKYYVSGLLERGIRVLIYAGTYDWQCSWVSNKLWVERLQWSGQDEFNAKNWRGWKITDDGDDVGLTKTAGRLTFTTVYAAGHMISPSLSLVFVQKADLIFRYVPHDKPLEALTMVSRWLADKDL